LLFQLFHSAWHVAKWIAAELNSSTTMAKAKKKKVFRAVSAVKALARERIGEPRPGQVVPDGKKKTKASEKHKPTLSRLLKEEENE
jgi:hypothetical protein